MSDRDVVELEASLVEARGDFRDAAGVGADDYAKERRAAGRDAAKASSPLGRLRVERDQAIDALRGRDRLICEALVATLDVDQIAKVTTYYNAHRPEDAGLLTVGGAS